MSNDADPTPRELLTTLIQHDSAIKGLSSDMVGLKSDVKILGSAVSSGFTDLGAKITKMSATNAARPTFDFHKWTVTILSLAILFSMIVGGIIYVAQSQFASVIAKQDATNERFSEKLMELGGRVGWIPTTKRER